MLCFNLTQCPRLRYQSLLCRFLPRVHDTENEALTAELQSERYFYVWSQRLSVGWEKTTRVHREDRSVAALNHGRPAIAASGVTPRASRKE